MDKLIDAGADPLAIDNEGNCALHFLAPRLFQPEKDLQHFTKFLEAGLDINASNDAGNTPLFSFILLGATPHSNPGISHRDHISVFLDKGADVNWTNKEGETLPHIAAKREKTEHRAIWNAPEEKRDSPVVDTFKMLMDLGLDPKKEDKQQRSPIDVAAACGHDDIVALFAQEI